MRQDSPGLGLAPLDITGYHPPWKQLTDFALRPDSELGGPHFSSLVQQVSIARVNYSTGRAIQSC